MPALGSKTTTMLDDDSVTDGGGDDGLLQYTWRLPIPSRH